MKFHEISTPFLPVSRNRCEACLTPPVAESRRAATPRLFKSFNYRCSWSDGWSNQMLRLDEYGGGDEAEYNSWVILEKAAAVREEAGSS